MRDELRNRCILQSCYFAILLLSGFISLHAQSAYKEKDLKESGTIRGTVKLACAVPNLDPMPVTKNPDQCGNSKLSPRLSLGKEKGVANTIIYLEGITEGKKCEKSKKVRLSQTRCEYSPHVMVVAPGTHLEIANNDVILHNVHAYDFLKASRSIFNIAQPIKGQCTPVKDSQLSQVGLIEATCDAGHPWMSAYIMVAPHPYYAVTDANGNFTLNNIPPGTYKLKMWHEGVAIAKTEIESGKVKKYYYEEPYESFNDVTVNAGGAITSNFDLKLRASSSEASATK
jgi:plastocyanin